MVAVTLLSGFWNLVNINFISDISSSVNSVHLSPEGKSIGTKAIQTKAKSIGLLLSVNFPPAPLPVVRAAASLSRQGFLTRVENMMLENINLDSVPHAACLGDIQADDRVMINKVQGDIASVLEKIKCRRLWIDNMKLSVGDTQVLLAGMVARVEKVTLGQWGNRVYDEEDEIDYNSSVEVDMETLASYDGRGQCTRLTFWWQTQKRYRAEVSSWAERVGWIVLGGGGHIEGRRRDDTSAPDDD